MFVRRLRPASVPRRKRTGHWGDDMGIGRRLRCPRCSAPIEWVQARAGRTFSCPRCKASLRIPRAYSTRRGLLVLVASVAGSIALGVTRWRLLEASVVGLVPLTLLVLLFSRLFLPPSLDVVSE